jgi:hypothetical protein
MIRRSTVVYIILLLVLAGAYWYLNNRQETADIEPTVEAGTDTAQTFLFPAEAGTPTRIRIDAKSGEVVEIARSEEDTWEVTEPEEAAADQAASEAAATQITTLRVLDRVPDLDPAIIGLEEPAYQLSVSFTSGEEQTVDVGDLTPSESGYYVRDGDSVVIVSRNAIDSVLRLLTDPPYQETPTPSP